MRVVVLHNSSINGSEQQGTSEDAQGGTKGLPGVGNHHFGRSYQGEESIMM